ncbi:MAG: DUF4012 domain-containing protein [Patescibacteria group bacterium]
MEIEKINLEPQKEEAKIRFFRKKWFWGVILGLLAVFILTFIPALFVINKVKAVYRETLKLTEVAKTKDLKLVSQQISETKKSLESLEKSLKPFFWVKYLPVFGSYEADAEHLVRAGEAGLEAGEIVVRAVEPYSDIIGFSGGGTVGGGEKTAEDRIAFVVTTIDKIGPDIEKVAEKLLIAQKEVSEINPRRYPEKFKGKKIREPLSEMIALVDQVATLTSQAKPLFGVAPYLLGIDSPRRYLIIFQNDGELRSTGGFMTAYAILEVSKGKPKPILSEDIYALDARYRPSEKAPEALVKYVPFPYSKDPRFRLRDMNISPDFKISMETFSINFQKASSFKYDGIVAIDTEVLVRLLKVLGQVGVPEWGNFSAEPDKRCDGCPQVVYELERLISKPTYEIKVARKAVIGPLMHSILANALGSPKEKIPGLFNAVSSSLLEKHVLFYFPDEKVQGAVESFNIAGRIKDYDGDYFHLNDTSFSGAKSNFFISQEVEQKIEIKDGKVVKTVTVEYKNPSPPSNCNLEAGQLCLNAPYRDWFRFYVPKGARLLESSGSEVEVKTYEELGKTVFEGFFGDKYPLRPQGSAKLVFKYELPNPVKKEYKLLIQKQPGTDEPEYSIILGNQKQEFELKTDRELKFKI